MSMKQKILDSINKLSEKEIEDQFKSGEGICVKLDDPDENCIMMLWERWEE